MIYCLISDMSTPASIISCIPFENFLEASAILTSSFVAFSMAIISLSSPASGAYRARATIMLLSTLSAIYVRCFRFPSLAVLKCDISSSSIPCSASSKEDKTNSAIVMMSFLISFVFCSKLGSILYAFLVGLFLFTIR